PPRVTPRPEKASLSPQVCTSPRFLGVWVPFGVRASPLPARAEGKGWVGSTWRWRKGALGAVEGATDLRNGLQIVASGTCGCLYTRYLSPETYLVPRMARVLPKALPRWACVGDHGGAARARGRLGAGVFSGD